MHMLKCYGRVEERETRGNARSYCNMSSEKLAVSDWRNFRNWELGQAVNTSPCGSTPQITLRYPITWLARNVFRGTTLPISLSHGVKAVGKSTLPSKCRVQLDATGKN